MPIYLYVSLAERRSEHRSHAARLSRASNATPEMLTELPYFSMDFRLGPDGELQLQGIGQRCRPLDLRARRTQRGTRPAATASRSSDASLRRLRTLQTRRLLADLV